MSGLTEPRLEMPKLRFLTTGRLGGSFAQNWGELDPVQPVECPAPTPQPPACLPSHPPRPSGFHQVPQQSGCDIMRQAGVSRVTFHGHNVWKSPNQNDPTDKLESRFPKWPLQLPREENSRPQPLLRFADGVTQAQRSPKQACPALSKGEPGGLETARTKQKASGGVHD